METAGQGRHPEPAGHHCCYGLLVPRLPCVEGGQFVIIFLPVVISRLRAGQGRPDCSSRAPAAAATTTSPTEDRRRCAKATSDLAHLRCEHRRRTEGCGSELHQHRLSCERASSVGKGEPSSKTDAGRRKLDIPSSLRPTFSTSRKRRYAQRAALRERRRGCSARAVPQRRRTARRGDSRAPCTTRAAGGHAGRARRRSRKRVWCLPSMRARSLHAAHVAPASTRATVFGSS